MNRTMMTQRPGNRRGRNEIACLLLCGAALCGSVGRVASAETPPPVEPQVAAASDEAEKSLSTFRVPRDWKGTVFAAEPLVANPVAFTIDGQGRFYVCETFRQEQGVEDNRKHGYWLDDDLAAQTVADRIRYMRKHRGDKAVQWEKQDDRIRLVVDRDGDGRADTATVFANRFNQLEAGTGAGVLSFGGNVYYTCIPDLWKLRDTNGDGQADERRSLQTGYGVRFAFRGHDLHGLCVGPDGKLYFSVGDRGFHVVTEGRLWANPECGAVFRCNPDGSDFEVVHYGLRNPQELAFDDYGNLFTCDNNSDSGDQARWTCIAEGGDSGWRMSYQYLPDRGPFNREKIWHPWHAEQPAYIVPPIMNLSSGPSGLAYYPGTGLSAHYQRRFFLCDFRGAAAGSVVRTFRVEQEGAFYKVVDGEETLGNILATDVEFGPDGAVYVSDWVNGWTGLGKGRIYRFVDPDAAAQPVVADVRTLLADAKFAQRPVAELARLLGHADRRIRQAAQFALVERQAVSKLLSAAMRDDAEQLWETLHGVWGLGQLARVESTADEATKALREVMVFARHDETRAQAARALGDARDKAALDVLRDGLEVRHARLRYESALALGKLRDPDAIEPLITMLAENDNKDPMLRHAGSVALAWIGGWRLWTPAAEAEGRAETSDPKSSTPTSTSNASDPDGADALLKAAKHPSPAVRLAIVLALRKLRSPHAARFLDDPDARIVLEAARAIHDEPIAAALPDLAARLNRPAADDALVRRTLNANYRLGQASHARAVAEFAAQRSAPEARRLDALDMLATWDAPSPRDRVINHWRPIAPRDKNVAIDAFRQVLPGLLVERDKVGLEGVKLAARFGIAEVGPVLRTLVADATQAARSRADALLALAAIKDQQLEGLVKDALKDDQPLVRSAAREVLARSDASAAAELLGKAAGSEDLSERQAAVRLLGTLKHPAADEQLSRLLSDLLAGRVPLDTRLDLLDAVAGRKELEFTAKLDLYESRRAKNDPLATFAETLAGGDAARGAQIFFERAQVSCVRCHRVGGRGGDVGPDLSKIGADKKRDYLLEAIVLPNKTIAKNFETVVLIMDSGLVHSGIVKAESDRQVQLVTPEGKLVTVDKASIEERREGKSAMPEDVVKQLSRADLRDLVEFLATQKP